MHVFILSLLAISSSSLFVAGTPYRSVYPASPIGYESFPPKISPYPSQGSVYSTFPKQSDPHYWPHDGSDEDFEYPGNKSHEKDDDHEKSPFNYDGPAVPPHWHNQKKPDYEPDWYNQRKPDDAPKPNYYNENKPAYGYPYNPHAGYPLYPPHSAPYHPTQYAPQPAAPHLYGRQPNYYDHEKSLPKVHATPKPTSTTKATTTTTTTAAATTIQPATISDIQTAAVEQQTTATIVEDSRQQGLEQGEAAIVVTENVEDILRTTLDHKYAF